MKEYILPIILTVLLIVGSIAILRHVIRHNRKLTLNNWTLIQGELGARKTAVGTRKITNLWRGRIIYNWLRPTLNVIMQICLFILPITNIIYIIIIIKNKGLIKLQPRGEDVYTSWPMWLDFPFGLFKDKWTFTYAVNGDVIDWKFKVTEDCILGLDEIGYIFPSENKKTDPKTIFTMTWFRHATGATVIAMTQSMSEVNITFRRKCNKVYQLTNGQRCIFPFGLIWSKVQVREVILSEDVNNIYEDNIETRNENWYIFKYPARHFESRYGKQLYNLTQEQIDKVALKYGLLFDYLKMKNGQKWTKLTFEIPEIIEEVKKIKKNA